MAKALHSVINGIYPAESGRRPSIMAFAQDHQISTAMQLAISNLTEVYPNGGRAIDNRSCHIRTGMFGLLACSSAGSF